MCCYKTVIHLNVSKSYFVVAAVAAVVVGVEAVAGPVSLVAAG